MKLATILEVDLDRSPPGFPAKLATPLAGKPVLAHTLERLRRSKFVDRPIVVVEKGQEQEAAQLCDGLRVQIEARRLKRPLYRRQVWSARKWAPSGWRGGLGDTTIFDEFMTPGELADIARRHRADAVLTLPAASVLIDPELIDRVASSHQDHFDEFRMTFTQAPPGMSVSVWNPSILEELAASDRWPGSLLAYHPDQPRVDSVIKDCCCPVDPVIARTGVRILADSERSLALCERILRTANGKAGEMTAVEICRRARREAGEIAAMPEEIEIELTTEDEFRDGLRPRRPTVSSRSPMSLELFERIVDEAVRCDDIRLTLGGFGEPTAHPEFDRILSICRDRRPFALQLQTNGLNIDSAVAERIVEADIDVVSVLLDAESPERYREIHGFDGFQRAEDGIRAIQEARESAGSATPLFVPVMVKSRQTFGGMKAFYDEWLRRVGAAAILGYSDSAGQRADHAVLRMAPPDRRPCRRLGKRMTILADGATPICEEDFNGKIRVGDVSSDTIGNIWGGKEFSALRQAHARGEYEANPLCGACGEWHRP
jgi:spiro-SPASM protein